MTLWTAPEVETLRALWTVHGGGFKKIAKIMGRSRGSIDGKSRVLGLQFHGGRAVVLENDHPAIIEGRSLFPKRVVAPDGNVLKTGDNQRKLGRMIAKGKWKGFSVFSLSLEERATCPRTCLQWNSCYTNNMAHAKRYRHGIELEEQIWRELWALQHKHPAGFVIRLHVAGDFPSVAYVDLWAAALDHFPAMRVFGYCAWKYQTPIGKAVIQLRNKHWDRFAIRTSGGVKGPRTVVFQQKPPPGVIPCPAQSGKTASCSTCALCWATTKAIGFRAH
jgi:hypothetical protein